MMHTVRVPTDKLREWLGHEAEIFDAWLTPDPIKPELVVVLKTSDEGPRRRRRDLAGEQLRIEAAADRMMMRN